MNRHPFAGLLLICASLMSLVSAPPMQAQEQAAPMVTRMDVPLYPPLARIANIEGVVHVKVTTDGKKAVSARAEDGHKLLADAAQLNAQTWQFVTHEPISFTVTYRYRLVTDLPEQYYPRVVLQLPQSVEVDILRWPTSGDPSPDKIVKDKH